MNTHVRDNLLETAPAKANAAGEIIVATGANSVDSRPFSRDEVATSETTTSTSYTDLATSGPAVTATTDTRALIFYNASIENNGAGNESRMDYAVSGATTRSASDATSLRATSSVANDGYNMAQVHLNQGLTAGSNTFTAKYRTDAGTATFAQRRITVLAL